MANIVYRSMRNHPVLSSLVNRFILQRASLSTIVFDFAGGIKSLRNEPTKIVGDPQSGEVLVKISAAPVTFEDLRSFRGLSPHRAQAGIAGTFAVGKITAVGHDVRNFRADQHVLVVNTEGTWTDTTIATRKNIFAIPSLPAESAALLPAVASAWAILHNYVKLQSGDVVVLGGKQTTINNALSQVANKLGVKVVVVSDEELADKGLKEKVQKNGNVKLAVSSVSGKRARVLADLLTDGGVLVTHNEFVTPIQEDQDLKFSVSPFIFNKFSVVGFDFAAFAKNSPQQCDDAVRAASNLLAGKDVKLDSQVFSNSKIQEAIEAANKGASVVLTVA